MRREQRVGPDLNTALMSKYLHTLRIRSLTPAGGGQWVAYPPPPLLLLGDLAADKERMKERG